MTPGELLNMITEAREKIKQAKEVNRRLQRARNALLIVVVLLLLYIIFLYAVKIC